MERTTIEFENANDAILALSAVKLQLALDEVSNFVRMIRRGKDYQGTTFYIVGETEGDWGTTVHVLSSEKPEDDEGDGTYYLPAQWVENQLDECLEGIWHLIDL